MEHIALDPAGGSALKLLSSLPTFLASPLRKRYRYILSTHSNVSRTIIDMRLVEYDSSISLLVPKGTTSNNNNKKKKKKKKKKI